MSLGGMVARLFAQRYPRQTAAVVLVDAYSEDAQLGLNGKLVRLRLLAKGRSIPAPRSAVAPDDDMTTTELKNAQDFIRDVIGKPKIAPPFDKLPSDAQRARLWAAVQPKSLPQLFAFVQKPHFAFPGEVPDEVLATLQSAVNPKAAERPAARSAYGHLLAAAGLKGRQMERIGKRVAARAAE